MIKKEKKIKEKYSDEEKRIENRENRKEKRKLKEALRKSKVDNELQKKALRARAMGACTSGPPKTFGEFFTPPTTAVEASVQPDSTIDTLPADDAAT